MSPATNPPAAEPTLVQTPHRFVVVEGPIGVGKTDISQNERPRHHDHCDDLSHLYPFPHKGRSARPDAQRILLRDDIVNGRRREARCEDRAVFAWF